MDTTEKYIKMCEKATEIQGHKFILGDYFCYSEDKDYVYIITSTFDTQGGGTLLRGHSVNHKDIWDEKEVHSQFSDKPVWLPTQDQLQEMMYESPMSESTVQDMVGYLYKFAFEESHGIVSMEQLWLTFIMESYHKKKWNGEDWVAVE